VTSRTQTVWTGALVAVMVGLAYANSLHGPFIFDDPSSITGNATIRHLTDWRAILRTPHFTVTAEGRPVLNLTLALNYAIGGTSVLGYHLFNLAVHLAATLTLFGLLRRIGPKDEWIAAAIAVVWAVHPLQTESVTYIVQRAESLMGLFYWLTLYGLVRAAEIGWSATSGCAGPDRVSCPSTTRKDAGRAAWGFAALSVAACWLGMATKEDMVSAPLIALLLDRTFLAGSFRAALQRRGAYYGALALSWLLLAYLIASTGGNRGGSVGFNLKIQTYEYWLTQFPAVIYYLRAVFWPHPLIFEYGTFWIRHLQDVAWQAALVGALVGGTIWALWRRPALGLAGAFFFALLAPTSLAPGTTQMIVEHRMYLPFAAVLAALGFAGVGRFRLNPRRTPAQPGRGARWSRRLTLAVAGLFALVCLVLTRRRNDDYRDAVGLWQLTVRQRPDNVLAHTMLGQVLDEAGRRDEAKEHFERALQLNPQFKLAQQGLQKVLTERAAPAGGARPPGALDEPSAQSGLSAQLNAPGGRVPPNEVVSGPRD